MARLCGYRGTRSGIPCRQLVEERHDHCESGHPVKVIARSDASGRQPTLFAGGPVPLALQGPSIAPFATGDTLLDDLRFELAATRGELADYQAGGGDIACPVGQALYREICDLQVRIEDLTPASTIRRAA
jgi:hypothetical protein